MYKDKKEIFMLRSRNVAVGKYYVNSARNIAREVLEIDDKIVKFNTHHLDTGNSCLSSSECTLQDFIHWANHEATPSEMASLHLRKMEAALYEPQLSKPQARHRIAPDRSPKSFTGETTFHHHRSTQ
jgi:hypothetical protein